MAGRKAVPTALKVLRGNPGKRPLNSDEPRVSSRIPSPPRHLTAEALEEWRRVVGALHEAGILSEIDRGTLSAYCQAYGRWVAAEESLKSAAAADPVSGGLTLTTSYGNIVQNPLVGVSSKAAAAMVKYAAELGMTPAARSRIKATPPDEEDPAEAYLN